MKRTLLGLLTLFQLHPAIAQKKPAVPDTNPYAAIDKKALAIPESQTHSTRDIAGYITANFTNQEDQVRAAFIWVSSNLQYDLANMFAINFNESKQDKIEKALRTRKGICENYAGIFVDICNKAGIKAYEVDGFTRQNGFTDYIPHAWCAALVNNEWKLYDPTWGSGYVNNKKFYKKLNNFYYQTAPANLIKSHMPFDYMWELLPYPVSATDFQNGKIKLDKSNPYFSYADTIRNYETLTREQQLNAEAARVEANGLSNGMVFDHLQHIKMELQNESVAHANLASANFNDAVSAYNDFINYRNKQFTPAKPDVEILDMLNAVGTSLQTAQKELKLAAHNPGNNGTFIAQIMRSIDDLDVRYAEQREWLAKYMSKGKSARRSMFYKTTWFGVPLN